MQIDFIQHNDARILEVILIGYIDYSMVTTIRQQILNRIIHSGCWRILMNNRALQGAINTPSPNHNTPQDHPAMGHEALYLAVLPPSAQQALEDMAKFCEMIVCPDVVAQQFRTYNQAYIHLINTKL